MLRQPGPYRRQIRGDLRILAWLCQTCMQSVSFLQLSLWLHSRLVFVADASWSILIHLDASWCILMHQDASWCILMCSCHVMSCHVMVFMSFHILCSPSLTCSFTVHIRSTLCEVIFFRGGRWPLWFLSSCGRTTSWATVSTQETSTREMQAQTPVTWRTLVMEAVLAWQSVMISHVYSGK